MGQYDWWNRISKYVKKDKGPTAVNVFMMSPGRQMTAARGVFSGAGPDGKIQPDRPAMLVDGANGQNVVHEGELAVNQGNNKINIIPHDRLSQAMGAPTQVAQTPEDQAKIADVQERTGMPGHQTGGTITIKPPTQPAGTFKPPTINPIPAAGSTPAPKVTPPPTTTNATNTSALPQSLYDTERSALSFNYGLMQGNNPVQTAEANKARQNYNAMGQSQFGSMVQSGLQDPNMTEGARNAMLATGNRDLAVGRSNLEGALSLNAQQAAQSAANNVFNQAGTLETQRQATQSSNDTRLADIVTRLTDPTTGTYTGSLDPNSMNPQLKQALQDAWTSSGQTGAMTADWIKNTVNSIANPQKTNATNVAWNTVLNSNAYKNAPADAASAPAGYTGMTQGDYKALFDFTQNNGMTVGHNTDGTIYFKDSQGNVVGGNKTAIVPTVDAQGVASYPNTPDGQAQQQTDYNTFKTNNPTSTWTVKDWLDNKAPTPAQYDPNASTEKSAFTILSNIGNAEADGKGMPQIAAIKETVDGLLSHATPTKFGTTGSATIKTISSGGVQIQSLDNAKTLPGGYNADLTTFVTNNRGKVVVLDGTYYQLYGDAQIHLQDNGDGTPVYPYIMAYTTGGGHVALELTGSGWYPRVAK